MRLPALLSFDPGFAAPSDWAQMYRACGWQVVPSHMPAEAAKWKRPRLAEWTHLQEEIIPPPAFERWYGPQGEHVRRPNMGLLTGRASQNVFVIDLDDYKSPSAQTWWHGALAVHNNGMELETVQQVTGGGGRQLFFRAPAGWQAPTNKTTIGVDLRGQGGFAVLPPSQHTSGNSYTWKEGAAPWECEIALAPDWLLQEITDLVAKYSGESERSDAPQERTATPETATNAFGLKVDLREEHMRDLIWASIVEWYLECPIQPSGADSHARMLEKYAVYERKVKSRLDGDDGLEREGRGLTEFTNKWRYAMRQWNEDIAEASRHWKKKEPPEPEPAPRPVDPETGQPLPLLLSAAQFVAGFTPPEYLVDGVMQRGYLYSLTARTGHGKTAVSMYLAQSVARGLPFHGAAVKQGTVLLLAGENPDDIRARFLVLADAMGFQAENLKMRFVAGVIDIAKSMPVIRVEVELITDLVLIIVDTAAAYFKGDDSNSNSQQGDYARLLRHLTFLPGKPAVLVNSHPVKNAHKDNLLPMGGSAFLNEVDGNLTLWANSEKQTTLHWLGKFRGPEFEPLTFEMRTVESSRVINSAGELMPSVIAEPVSEIKLTFAENVQEREEETLLGHIAKDPKASIADLAIRCGFVSNGRPMKSKVFRLGQRLIEDKLVERMRGKLRITPKGMKEIGRNERVE